MALFGHRVQMAVPTAIDLGYRYGNCPRGVGAAVTSGARRAVSVAAEGRFASAVGLENACGGSAGRGVADSPGELCGSAD